MNYKEATEYLDSLNVLGSVPGLDSIRELLHRLGNPQNLTRYVHVAGTNGKGSTCAYIREILMDAGLKVGGFNSPAVFDALEIITCNNTNISQEEFAKCILVAKKACDDMVLDGLSHPTRFEIETAVSFMFFAKNKCDIAVVECGMGGLYDSTNIISTTECAVITSLSIDHTGFLGNSLSEIAAHKAGIIKDGIKVISAQDLEEINNATLLKNATLIVPDVPSNIKYCTDGIEFDYKDYKGLKTGLLGAYQPGNAALSIECIQALCDRGYVINEDNIRNGIKKATIKGRFTKISDTPDFYIDGAHNYSGAKMLASCIKNICNDKKITLIVGVFKDKEYNKIMDELLVYAGRVYTIATPNNERALSSKLLAEFIKNNYDVDVHSCDDIKEAVKLSYESTNKDDVIIACGSLSHLAIIEKEVERYNNG